MSQLYEKFPANLIECPFCKGVNLELLKDIELDVYLIHCPKCLWSFLPQNAWEIREIEENFNKRECYIDMPDTDIGKTVFLTESEAKEALKELEGQNGENLSLYKQGGLCLVPADVYKKQCDELDELKEKHFVLLILICLS